MKFHRIIGKIDPVAIADAEKKLSVIFLELASKPSVKIFGSQLGGDPLLFSLIFPMQHVATCNIATAATDGKRYYWNPHFVNSLSLIGTRLTCGHEAWHSLFLHPQRRGVRHPKIYNIAVDFVANTMVMRDLKQRGFDPSSYYSKHLGNFLTLPQTIEMFQNPFLFAQKSGLVFKHVLKETSDKNIVLPSPNEEKDLTDEEKKQIEEQMKDVRFFYADPNIDDDILRPETIYEMLLKVIPRDPATGELGVYYPEGEEDGPGYDIFGLGDLLDDHIDSEETVERTTKRFNDAMNNAKAMGGAGNVGDFLERELHDLTKPKIKWTDFLRVKLSKTRSGNSKNDWSRFRSRPLMGGLMVPKKKGYSCKFGCLLDTSGSMTKDDLSLGLSQLIGLDGHAEGFVVSCDTDCHWDKATKLRNVNKEELLKIKPIGGGGTRLSIFFNEYEKNFGKCDFLVILTDGILSDIDVSECRDPGIPTYWIITSMTEFNAPFGRAFSLRD